MTDGTSDNMLCTGFVYSARVPGYIRDYKRVFYQGSTGEMEKYSQAPEFQHARPKGQSPEHESMTFEPFSSGLEFSNRSSWDQGVPWPNSHP